MTLALNTEQIALGGTVHSTRLGFGCGGLMQEPSRQARQRVLAAAYEEGIRHFDVARMYGLGAAESELGAFARTRREHMTIASKFGIEASAPGQLARLQGPARRLLARYPALRGLVKRHSDALHQPRRYDAQIARRSLQTSLRELGTDHLDIFFIHDPAPSDHVDLDGIAEYLEAARQAGDIRAWGIAGEPEPCLELRRSLPDGSILQVREDILTRTAATAADGSPKVVFGVLAEPLTSIREHLSGAAERRQRWSEAIGADCGSAQVLASLLLADALDANRDGVVLYSSTKPERLRELGSRLRSMVHRTQLECFRRQVALELNAQLPEPACG